MVALGGFVLVASVLLVVLGIYCWYISNPVRPPHHELVKGVSAVMKKVLREKGKSSYAELAEAAVSYVEQKYRGE